MKKKYLLTSLFLLATLSSCQNELVKYEFNEFLGYGKDENCDFTDIINYYGAPKTSDNHTTLCLLKINKVDNQIYMQTETEFYPDYSIHENKYTSLKGYDNGIRLIVLNCTVIEDYYSKGQENRTINVPFYLNYSYNQTYDFDKVYSFFSSFNKMIYHLNSDYLKDSNLFLANKNQKIVTFNNLAQFAKISYKNLMSITDDKLDINKYEENFNAVSDNYKERLSDGMSLEKIKEAAKKIYEDCKLPDYNDLGCP